ncbi:alpha/beta hydrolase [Eremomyces bilateralis CBS 781.70]|uniref:Alpha/beta hydrolase n=1 Tax=Eremomyces bilateralis CBS 781.70 TaxID=1392243 RepID=A0A6G1G0C0_9PEZI|nr:alpha/beta hydrolase [Eremomyces bilateralis CBS 781.70]KAF1811555.1 alpha/beta hydrolase [Eremomyces bilateralis CBS 781.70]
MTTAEAEGSGRGRSQQSPLASQRVNEVTSAPTGRPASRFDQYFPLGYKEGFNQWWTGLAPARTEHRVLSYIPHLQKPPTHTHTGTEPLSDESAASSISEDASDRATPVVSADDPFGPRRWQSTLVKLSGKQRALNEFSVERIGEEVENNVVILHGYGAGLGFFYKNFEALSRAPGWRLYALDMLGMGRSSRPPFRIHAKDKEDKIREAESWFIDALEEWRIQKKIDKFTLLGHSLGGYMAVAYAIKYPGRLNKLILASPVGIPEDPYAVAADLPEPGDSALASEFTQDQEEVVNPPSRARTPARKATSPPTQPPRRPIPKWLTYLWDANISPFSVVRWAGPLGPRLVSGWTSRRFSHLPEDEALALHDYSYSLFRQRGSGEYALAYVLAPGAFARSPLIRRIDQVGRMPLAGDAEEGGSREQGVPVVLMYGDNDWMDVRGGFAAQDKLQAARERALQGKSSEERKRDQGDAKVMIVKNAGHHLYLDGAEEFNDMVTKEMRDVERRQRLLNEGGSRM